MNTDKFKIKREQMVQKLKSQGIIESDSVFNAMLTIPRHEFISPSSWEYAYIDSPLQIDENQTISAPHMNAMMCEYLDLKPGQKVLEIGTGSGYHAALLAKLVSPEGHVYTIERHSKLAHLAEETFNRLNFSNITVITGDGTLGWELDAPYDRILVTAAAPTVPKPLITQLSPDHGILCLPVGTKHLWQNLYVVIREGNDIQKHNVCGVRFVPLIGKYGFNENQ
ncbi:MAG: protein-L-isoaspartate(D-aspartate) O-methyltransferase [Promethearchaeota archaeon]